jgi:hypothetical protein
MESKGTDKDILTMPYIITNETDRICLLRHAANTFLQQCNTKCGLKKCNAKTLMTKILGTWNTKLFVIQVVTGATGTGIKKYIWNCYQD